MRTGSMRLQTGASVNRPPSARLMPSAAPFVGMKSDSLAKSLKNLERVEGIEPSYSAWKAAALPLSYTRDGVDLTRRAGGLNPPLRPHSPVKTAQSPGACPVRPP